MAAASSWENASLENRSLFDSSFAASEKPKVGRTCAAKSIDTLVSKKLYDHFIDFSEFEVNGMLDGNGKNLMTRMTEYIDMHLRQPKQ